MAAPVAAGLNPFPGIRAFEADESQFFHGRKEHTQALLRLLGEQRFLAVVGTSGSGKSSLVKAGLLPALKRGYLRGATSKWRIALMRPGGEPICALADALRTALDLSPSVDEIRARLEATSMGMVSLVGEAGLPAGHSLLVVVDQFEELFRFRRESQSKDGGKQAALFVNLLLAAAAQSELPIFTVLTMRSDFLGDCAQFSGLPEALNSSQYLIPRLTRDQREQAIVTPLDMVGVDITPGLVQRLLNDTGDDPDQLPALQHSLMTIYNAWRDSGSKGPIDLPLYVEARQIGNSLDSHASGLYSSLSVPDKLLATHIFRALTTVEEGRAVRRPAQVGRLYRIAGAADAAQQAAINHILRLYAARENSLVFSSTGDRLTPTTIIDITHESLIRQWSLLQVWVRQEAESASWYKRLVQSAKLREEGKAAYWPDPDAGFAWKHRTENFWNAAWADQYAPGYEEAIAFLNESRRLIDLKAKQEEERRRAEVESAISLAKEQKERADEERRSRIRLRRVLAALILASAAVVYLGLKATKAERLANELRQANQVAEQLAKSGQRDAEAALKELQAARLDGEAKAKLLADAKKLRDQSDDLKKRAQSSEEKLKSASDVAVQKINELDLELRMARAETAAVRAEYTKLKSAQQAQYAQVKPPVQPPDAAGTGSRDVPFGQIAINRPAFQPPIPATEFAIVAPKRPATLKQAPFNGAVEFVLGERSRSPADQFPLEVYDRSRAGSKPQVRLINLSGDDRDNIQYVGRLNFNGVNYNMHAYAVVGALKRDQILLIISPAPTGDAKGK